MCQARRPRAPWFRRRQGGTGLQLPFVDLVAVQ